MGTGRVRVRRRTIARSAAGLLFASVVAATSVVGLPTAAATAGGWVVVTSTHVSGRSERPLAVVAPAPGDVWAIGYSLNFVGGAVEFRTLAEHYDGSRFVSVPTPDRETAPAEDFLNGAAAAGPNDIWAVGTSVGGGRQPDQTLIEHWDGTSWTIATSPNPGAVGNDLQAAAASSASDVWAVGARTDAGHFYQVPMTLHFNGSRWTTVPVPNPLGCTGHSYLTGVADPSPISVWATGWCGSGGSAPERGYVLHWNGREWSIATVIPQTVAPESEVYGIAASLPNNVWVVGYYRQADGTAVPLTYHFTGRAWNLVAGPTAAYSFAGVSIGARGVWAVGAGPSPQPPFAGPAAAQRTSTGWVTRAVPVSFGSLAAVTTAPDGAVWAVGMQILPSGDDTALIVHR